tara:strand:- start:56 stop:193 length:138 start_codon:yes stop_codon:yes gene_type:complete
VTTDESFRCRKKLNVRNEGFFKNNWEENLEEARRIEFLEHQIKIK